MNAGACAARTQREKRSAIDFDRVPESGSNTALADAAGTNQPGLLPGRVSHGCVRVPNRNIKRLSRLMPIGTPLHIK